MPISISGNRHQSRWFVDGGAVVVERVGGAVVVDASADVGAGVATVLATVWTGELIGGLTGGPVVGKVGGDDADVGGDGGVDGGVVVGAGHSTIGAIGVPPSTWHGGLSWPYAGDVTNAAALRPSTRTSQSRRDRRFAFIIVLRPSAVHGVDAGGFVARIG
jgi:hypothetical protein